MHFSVLDPASPQAAERLWLWNACMWVCGFILALVAGLIVYILFRYRHGNARQPSQTTGNKKLEVTWTAVPIGLVAFLFVLSALAAREVDRPIRREPDVVVTGHQWWWEVRYPAANVITANEIYVPVGRDMLIAIEAADVLHDFWVPRLGRKVDPGRRNFVWIRAEQAGIYSGACAEFCGAQHGVDAFPRSRRCTSGLHCLVICPSPAGSHAVSSEAQLGKMRFGELTCVNFRRGIANRR